MRRPRRELEEDWFNTNSQRYIFLSGVGLFQTRQSGHGSGSPVFYCSESGNFFEKDCEPAFLAECNSTNFVLLLQNLRRIKGLIKCVELPNNPAYKNKYLY